MTTRDEAIAVVVGYMLDDFDVTTGGGAPAEMMEQIQAGIGAGAAIAVDALAAAGMLELDPS